MADAKETFAYYPGCLAGESAREYDASIRWLAREVNVELQEIDDWSCCGAGVVQDLDPQAGRALAKRNLDLAAGRGVLSGCPNCVARLQEAGSRDSACHVLGLFTRADVREKIAAKIKAAGEKRPVGSLKVACLYSCELSNPDLWALGGEAVESPIELLMEAAGATVVNWGGMRRCTGGYLLLAKPELGFEMLEKTFRDFEHSGADAIVTACPHGHFNLDAFQHTLGRQRRRALEAPVLHFTEVLALAMCADSAGVDRWLDRHVTSAFPLIERLVSEEEKRKAAERPRKSEVRNHKFD
jgi:heterodisulfide reductase subunit B